MQVFLQIFYKSFCKSLYRSLHISFCRSFYKPYYINRLLKKDPRRLRKELIYSSPIIFSLYHKNYIIITLLKTFPKRLKKRSKRLKKSLKNKRLDNTIAKYIKALIVYYNNLDSYKKSLFIRLIALFYKIISFTLKRRVAN